MRPCLRLTPLVLALPLALGCGMGYAPRSDPTAAKVPGGGYAAFAHHGTNPVVDADEEALVRVGLAVDRASWALVLHYLAHDVLPPPEAVRVEDCVHAMAPAPRHTPSAGIGLALTLAPSPFRAGWSVLVVSVAAPATPATHGPSGAGEVLVVSRTPDGALERALAAAGARLYAGDPTRLPSALEAAERLVLVDDAAGLGGVAAQGPLLDAIARAHADGARVSVVGRIGPGLDDALLDRIAEVGGGVHELAIAGDERGLAARLVADGGLADATAELRFDPAVVERWRLVGHESRLLHAATRGLAPSGGFIPAGDAAILVVELKLAPGVAPGRALGRLAVRAEGEAREVALTPGAADAHHYMIVVVAALAEKLRGSFWMKDLAWDALAAELARIGTPAFRDEVGGVLTKARALWVAAGGAERPIAVVRRLP